MLYRTNIFYLTNMLYRTNIFPNHINLWSSWEDTTLTCDMIKTGDQELSSNRYQRIRRTGSTVFIQNSHVLRRMFSKSTSSILTTVGFLDVRGFTRKNSTYLAWMNFITLSSKVVQLSFHLNKINSYVFVMKNIYRKRLILVDVGTNAKKSFRIFNDDAAEQYVIL